LRTSKIKAWYLENMTWLENDSCGASTAARNEIYIVNDYLIDSNIAFSVSSASCVECADHVFMLLLQCIEVCYFGLCAEWRYLFQVQYDTSV
jgi:hypothetical protein